MIGREADHVDRLIPRFAHQTVDIGFVGRDDFVLAGAGCDRLARFPLFEANADLAQFIRDSGVFPMQRQFDVGMCFVENA